MQMGYWKIIYTWFILDLIFATKHLLRWHDRLTKKCRYRKSVLLSFGHTRPIVDPKLILGIRITKPPWPSTVPPSLFSPIKRFSESDTKDQVRIRIRWKSVVCGWSFIGFHATYIGPHWPGVLEVTGVTPALDKWRIKKTTLGLKSGSLPV